MHVYCNNPCVGDGAVMRLDVPQLQALLLIRNEIPITYIYTDILLHTCCVKTLLLYCYQTTDNDDDDK